MREQLATHGHFLQPLVLPETVATHVAARDWVGLDREVHALTRPGGVIFEALRPYADFREIEFIISIRSSNDYPDEDGIWHDDGSRVLAFTLSLTREPEAIDGGRLEFRRCGDEASPPVASIPTPPYGTLIIFATGISGFEHRICRVARGERLIIAGWAS